MTITTKSGTKLIQMQMLKDVSPYGYGTLVKGSIHTVELLSYGTNWKRVRFNNGPAKTLFNFDAVRVG